MTKFKRFFLALILAYSPCHADILLNKITLAELKGKWVFINYWASWCPSCIEEIKDFNNFQEHNSSKATVLAVNFDYLPKEELELLVKKLNIRYPNLATDPAKDLGLEAIRGIPVTFVFDPNGKLAATLYGPQNEKSLNKAMG